MKVYDFALYVDAAVLTDEEVERLFQVCDDVVPVSSCGEAKVCFSRDAESLEAAIRSAVADVSRAGLRPTRVEIPDDSVQELCHAAADSGD
ncbi:MAG: hypothetical protein KY476_01305 [Planctomycetes bacterium]|nr:hypothetical protein [Planctomycetota bacterium]